MAQIRLIKIKDHTDGDASHLPNPQTHTQVSPPDNYLEKLGTLWMQHEGRAQAGITYKIDRLPDGYTVWVRLSYIKIHKTC